LELIGSSKAGSLRTGSRWLWLALGAALDDGGDVSGVSVLTTLELVPPAEAMISSQQMVGDETAYSVATTPLSMIGAEEKTVG
jgi:hypothetical protein